MSFYIPLFLFCISSTITPGPNNLMLLISSIRIWCEKDIISLFRSLSWLSFMVLIIGIGLESIFINHLTLHTVIKVVGGVYMLWLAFKIILSSNFDDEKSSEPLSFTQAALFQWINPKAWIMAIGVISTYTVVSTDMSLLLQVIIITVIYMIVSFLCTGFWLFGGSSVKRILNNENHLRVFKLILGLLLILSIVLMIFE